MHPIPRRQGKGDQGFDEKGTLKAESDLMPGIFIRDGGDRSEEIVSAIREQQDGYVGRRIKIDKSFSLNMIQKLFSGLPTGLWLS
jgi:hypothetical protein